MAVPYFQEAIRLDPQNVGAHFDMANALYKKGHTYDAMRQYERTLTLDPHHRWAHFNLGGLSRRPDRLMGVLEQYPQTARLSPEATNRLFATR